MKHVFTSKEIPHLWAHKTQAEARNQQGNFYFTGDTIYSYGSHFPIARHVLTADGRAAVLLTTRTYSNTTARQVSAVKAAIPPELPVFRVLNPAHDTVECMRNLSQDAAMALTTLVQARNRKASIAKAWVELASADRAGVEFAAAFGLEYVSQLPPDAERYRAIAAEYDAGMDARREQRVAAMLEARRRRDE